MRNDDRSHGARLVFRLLEFCIAHTQLTRKIVDHQHLARPSKQVKSSPSAKRRQLARFLGAHDAKADEGPRRQKAGTGRTRSARRVVIECVELEDASILGHVHRTIDVHPIDEAHEPIAEG